MIFSLLLLAPVAAPALAQENESVHALSIVQDAFEVTPAAPSVARPLRVDATDFLSVLVSSPSKTLTVALVTPSGTRFQVGDPAGPMFRGGVFPDPQDATVTGANYMINVTNPPVGLWMLEVSQSPAPASVIDVLVWASLNNGTGVVLLGGGETYPLGAPVTLGLAAFDGATRLGSLTITANAFRSGDPTFPVTPVTFRDDGAGGDPTAGDKIYYAQITPPAAGDYQVQAAISGTASTGTFARTAAVEFPVVARTATLDGTFADRGIDANTPADTLLNQVAIAPRFSLPSSGEYNVTVKLRASNGNTLTRSFEGGLEAGPAAPEVRFDTADIRDHLGVDGPYAVAEVRVDRVNGEEVTVADLRYELGSTAAYDLDTFQTPPVGVAGVIASEGLDTDGNGLFDRLAVDVELALRAGAEYEYSASLVDARNRELQFYSISAVPLAAGKQILRFVFDGGRIGANGVDGPFELRNLILTDHGENTAIANRVGRTAAFQAAQFEPLHFGLRGDSNGDGRLSTADIFFLLSHLFSGGSAPPTRFGGDANGDGRTTVADVFFLMHHFFTDGAPPPV